jgi:Peptidase family S41
MLSKSYYRYLAVIICLLLTKSFLGQSTYTETVFSKTELLADYDLLKTSILKNHPGAFIYKSKAAWDPFFELKKTEIKDKMTETEFLKFISTVTNEIKCGHTTVNYSIRFLKKNLKKKHLFLPFSVWLDSGKIKITKFAKKDSANLLYNAEIVSINNIPADSIYKTISTIPSSDGFSKTNKLAFANYLFKPYYRRYFGESDSFLITYKNKSHANVTKYLKATNEIFPQPNFEDYFFRRKDKIVFSSFGNDFLMFDTLGLNIPVLKLRSFTNNYAPFYKSIFAYLHHFKLKILVLDLRNNGGGNLFHAERLLSYLIDSNNSIVYSKIDSQLVNKKYYSQKLIRFFSPWFFKNSFIKEKDKNYLIYEHIIKPQKSKHFNGKIFVLTNGGSFSASCIAAAYLKNKADVTIIGEETGGTASGCNAVQLPQFTLPNTGIRVIMPLYRVSHILPEIKFGEGIKPHIEVKYKAIDIINKTDLDWKMVLKLLKPNEM